MYSNWLQNCRGGSTLKENHQKKPSSSRCQWDKQNFFWRAYYFCRPIVGGTKIIYNKSLPVNYVIMLKINTRKLKWIKTNKQWVINTNWRKYRSFALVNSSHHLFLIYMSKIDQRWPSHRFLMWHLKIL